MRRVQSIAVRAQFGGADDGASKDPNLIPIDRDAASEVVARFLAEKKDDGDFRRRLVDRLKRGSH